MSEEDPAWAEAARLEEDGSFFEAGLAFSRLHEEKRALENLVRVRPSHPRYRDACREAIVVAERGAGPTLAFENLLGAFVQEGPRQHGELEVFERLSRLYERTGFSPNAAEVLRKMQRLGPLEPASAERLARLTQAPADLPDLPELAPEAAWPAPPAEGFGPLDDDPGLAFQTGAVIANRYRLEERIGKGGTSVVFRATDLEVGDTIAMKVLTQAVFDREADDRFRRELLLSRRIQHPNVVRLYDVGLAHGFRYVTLELLTGQDLRRRMRGRPLPLAEGLTYLIQACRGLEAAHEQGIIHRDVKPENCFLVQGGGLKVTDFGLAKLQNAGGVTATGVIAGTPAYMAPEQVTDFRRVGPLADLYAVGVMAYEIHTGTLPFHHPESISLLLMHASDEPPRPRDREPSMPEELEEIILQCLEKEPEKRISSCGELAARLEALRARVA
jgi:eukaryotic-like serine/threonine-protein kinase